MKNIFKKSLFFSLFFILFGVIFKLNTSAVKDLPNFSAPKFGIVDVKMQKYGKYVVATIEEDNFVAYNNNNKFKWLFLLIRHFTNEYKKNFHVIKIKKVMYPIITKKIVKILNGNGFGALFSCDSKIKSTYKDRNKILNSKDNNQYIYLSNYKY